MCLLTTFVLVMSVIVVPEREERLMANRLQYLVKGLQPIQGSCYSG